MQYALFCSTNLWVFSLVQMERERQICEEGKMAKPETLGLMQSARVSTVGSEMRMP